MKAPRFSLVDLPEPARRQAEEQLGLTPGCRGGSVYGASAVAALVAGAAVPADAWCGRERDFQREAEKYLESLGCLVFHPRISMGSRGGWPDITALCSGGKVLLIELKTAKGVLSAAQKEFVAQAAKYGHRVHVCRGMSQVGLAYRSCAWSA